ncbi:MAG: hypothetical protein ACYS18_10575 [Planctomycetota bacterium]|jgi:hypothetical protein
MIACLVIVVLLIIGCFLMSWLHHYKVFTLLCTGILLLTAFVGGGYVSAEVDSRLAPYFFFGVRRAVSERIRVVSYQSGRYKKATYTFSNGETLPTEKSLALNIVMQFAFLVAAGTVLIGGRAVILLTLDKFFPKVYAGVAPYLLEGKW